MKAKTALRETARATRENPSFMINNKKAELADKLPADVRKRFRSFLVVTPFDNAAYDALIAELRSAYAPKRRQRAARLLQGFTRDGRTPLALLSVIDNAMAGLDLDDIRKELLINAMPPSIRALVTHSAEAATPRDLARDMERHFTSSGDLINSSAPRNVAAVTTENIPDLVSTAEEEFDDFTEPEPAPVNAARERGRPRHRGSNRGGQTRSSTNGGDYSRGQNHSRHNDSSGDSYQKRSNSNRQKPNIYAVCWKHKEFGEKARGCDPACVYWSKFLGNGNAGGRA